MNTNTPDSPGVWWFSGVAIVPHSTTPGNETTVHIREPRRFEVVETQYGLIPTEPANNYPYPLIKFVGQWTKATR